LDTPRLSHLKSLLTELDLKRAELFDTDNDLAQIHKQQREATTVSVGAGSEDLGFGNMAANLDTSTFRDVTSMIKVGKKRIMKQMEGCEDPEEK
jgi:hypothetical protein